MKNTSSFYIVFQVLKVLLRKICKSYQIFYFLLFLLAFSFTSISADIIFHTFLKLHSTLSEKKNFVRNFPEWLSAQQPGTQTQLFKSFKFGRSYLNLNISRTKNGRHKLQKSTRIRKSYRTCWLFSFHSDNWKKTCNLPSKIGNFQRLPYFCSICEARWIQIFVFL